MIPAAASGSGFATVTGIDIRVGHTWHSVWAHSTCGLGVPNLQQPSITDKPQKYNSNAESSDSLLSNIDIIYPIPIRYE